MVCPAGAGTTASASAISAADPARMTLASSSIASTALLDRLLIKTSQDTGRSLPPAIEIAI